MHVILFCIIALTPAEEGLTAETGPGAIYIYIFIRIIKLLFVIENCHDRMNADGS